MFNITMGAIDSATLLVCFEIFICRIVDVTMGTVKEIILIRGRTFLATLIGFIELIIWYLMMREAFSSDSGILTAIAYAGGFAVGTFLGARIADNFVVIKIGAQVITGSRDMHLIDAVLDAGYGVSVVDVTGAKSGDGKYMLIIELTSNRLKELKTLIHSIDPGAFITTHESKQVYNGYIRQQSLNK